MHTAIFLMARSSHHLRFALTEVLGKTKIPTATLKPALAAQLAETHIKIGDGPAMGGLADHQQSNLASD